MEYSIWVYFLLFLTYSFIGWIIEEIVCSIDEKKIVNRGFLIGPICPIYGFGGLLITILLGRYKEDWVTLFIMAVIVCGVLEYFTSWAMEKIFHARWWDYSRYKFNINGRICLETIIPFGVLGLIVTYISNPFFIGILTSWNLNTQIIISIISTIIVLTDVIVSFNVISKVRKAANKISKEARKDNTQEITEQVKEELRASVLGKRLIDAFPKLVAFGKKVKDTIEDGKEKIGEKVEVGKEKISDATKKITKVMKNKTDKNKKS